MLRLIIIFLIFMFIKFCLQFITKIVGFVNKKSVNYKDHKNSKNYNKNPIQDLTQCKYCGLYTPVEESIYYNGKTFCCKEHIHM